MSETSVGERPVTGGRVREYGSAAERARAWRERQRERAAAGPDQAGGAAPEPALASASLAATLEALREVLSGHRSAVGEQVERVEQAIAVLADPDAVEEALEAGRAEAARQVAEVTDRAARARQASSQAEAETRTARAEAVDATEAATAAWERVETLEVELVERDRRLAEMTEQAAAAESGHAAALAARDGEHQAALGQVRAQGERELAGLREQADARAVELTGRAERAQATTTAIREELSRVRGEADRARHDAAAALTTARAEAEARQVEALAAAGARYDGESAGLRARLEAAQEVGDARRDELTRTREENGRLLTLLDALHATTNPPLRRGGARRGTGPTSPDQA